jgi:serine/threonine protein kinase
VSDIQSRLTTVLSDRYRVERELGAGGMATVYLAHDLRHERDVAIKVLHPDLGAALGAERFLSEIRTTARLQHPHILPLLDSGAADGLLYYVMPYVRGETLRARLEREKQLPIADAVRIARVKSPPHSTTRTSRASFTETSSRRIFSCRMARRWWRTSVSRWPCSRPAGSA